MKLIYHLSVLLDTQPIRNTGSVKANGSEPKSCLGRVFNFKLGHFVMCTKAWPIQAGPSPELKTWPRFRPVSLSCPCSKHPTSQCRRLDTHHNNIRHSDAQHNTALRIKLCKKFHFYAVVIVIFFVAVLSFILLNAIILSVIVVVVMAPNSFHSRMPNGPQVLC